MRKFILILLIALSGCVFDNDKPKVLSFQNQWGLAYFISPRDPRNGCRYTFVFLPLKKLADTSLITGVSSIFDFKYDNGITFLSDNRIFLDEIHSSNPQKPLYIKDNSSLIIYWAFMKLKYHGGTADVAMMNDLNEDTLMSKTHILPVKYYPLDRNIVFDTAYSKKKYINPWNDPKFKSKMSKYNMPCFTPVWREYEGLKSGSKAAHGFWLDKVLVFALRIVADTGPCLTPRAV